MIVDISSFSQSVQDIEGLTAYTPWVLPKWFRSRAKGVLIFDPEGLSDERLVSLNFEDLKLNEWGTAVIDGREVFVFETQFSEWLEEHYMFAEFLRGTFNVVEDDARRDGAKTAYYSEGLRRRRPRTADGSAHDLA